MSPLYGKSVYEIQLEVAMALFVQNPYAGASESWARALEFTRAIPDPEELK